MQTNIIINDMKEGSKPFRNVMIFGYTLMILTFLAKIIFKNNIYLNNKVFIFAIAYFGLGCVGLYGYLYTLKYKLEISEEKIRMITLFRKVELDICVITKYTFKKYNKRSKFYQFRLYTKERKNFLISTKYKDELITLLNDCELLK